MTNITDWPRRSCVDKWVQAEVAISAARDEVERMGADVRLTDAVMLLGEAMHAVADYVDGVHKRRAVMERPW